MIKELSDMSLEELWQLFPIILTKHNREWHKWYGDEHENLNNILVDIDVKRISHIGSTAIHGIWAKPIIDILIEIEKKSDMKVVKLLLLNQGYLCMSESDTKMIFNKGYTKYGFAKRVYHIHIRLAGDNDELYFRDYMNDKDQLAKEYEEMKLLLWKQYEHDRDAYTNAKTDFIKKCTTQAKMLYGDRYNIGKEDTNEIN